MPVTGSEALSNQRGTSLQVHKLHLRPSVECLPVGAFQRRAGQHNVATTGDPTQDRLAKVIEPGWTIFVSKRNAVAYFLNIHRRVEVVGVGEFPVELLGQQPPDGGLAAADYSHDDYDHRAYVLNSGTTKDAQVYAGKKSRHTLLLRISLLYTRSRVGDAECAIWRRCDLDRFAFAVFFHVGDVFRVNVVLFVGLGGIVKLVQVLKPGRIVHDLPCGGARALSRTVINHGDPRVQRPIHSLRVREIRRM